jgi:hypothetical protein
VELNKNKELRMYTLVLYQLSPSQAMIQAGHSWIEYGRFMRLKASESQEDKVEWAVYEKWEGQDKTVYVMNGGSSSMLAESIEYLKTLDVKFAVFREPDLYDQVTAVSFIADERIFGKPSFDTIQDMTVQEIALGSFVERLKFHGGR